METNFYISSCCENGGIYHYVMSDNGEVEFRKKTNCKNPMYSVIDNDKMYIILRDPFSTNTESGITYYDINSDGTLSDAAHEIISTKGEVCCHLCVDSSNVYAVNYISGSVIKLPDKLVIHHGSGPNTKRQDKAHAHFVSVSPSGEYVYVVDLGMDKIMTYDKDLNFVSSTSAPAGIGPRHLAFSDDGKYAFCINELDSSVSVYLISGSELILKQTVSTLPEGCGIKNTAAAIRFRDGHVYASNRGHNSIACFEFANNELVLKHIVDCGGAGPRDFNFVGDNYIVCTNENSNNVTFFKLDNDNLEKLNFELKDITGALCVTV